MTSMIEYSHGEILCWGAHFNTNVCLQESCLFESLKRPMMDAFAEVERWDLRVQRCLVLRTRDKFRITAFHEPVQVEIDPQAKQATVICDVCWECGNATAEKRNTHQPWCNVGVTMEIMEN